MGSSARFEGTPRPLVFLWVVLVGLLSACVGRHAAPHEYPPLTAAPRVPSGDEPDVAVSLYHVTYRFDETGNHTTTIHDVYKVLTDEGVENWSESAARWSPWRMDRPVIRATVTPPGGAPSKLEPSALSDVPAYPETVGVYGDERVLRGPLPNVKVGAIVDEETVTRAKGPYPGAEAYTVPFQVSIPREKVELVLDVPEKMALHYEVRDAKVAISDERRGGRRVITFTGGPYEAIKRIEPNAPSHVITWPHVAFTTGAAWRDVAAAYARIVREKTAGTSFDDVVAKIVAPADPPALRAQKILTWVRERVRYVGVEFGESSIVPHAPAETLRHGYGDCKDQAVLMVVLLRAAGLSPRVALLDAGGGEDVDAALPALNVFDHAIVVVPGKSPLWIDPTATRARPGELPVGDQGRYALIVDDETDALTQTPAPSESANTYHETRRVSFEGGKTHVVERSMATGAIEQQLRNGFDLSRADLDKWAKDYVDTMYASKAGPSRFETSKVNDLSTRFEMTVETKDAAGLSSVDLVSASVSLGSKAVFDWLPRALTQTGGEERRTDLAVSTPYDAELTYEVHPPDGFVVDETPALVDTPMGPAVLKHAVEKRADGVVVVRHRFVLPKPVWSAREVNAFRKAYAEYLESPRTTVTFVHAGEKERKARRIDKEIALYRQQARERPRDAAARMRLADAMLGAGFGATARRLVDEATKLAPEDAQIWTYAAFARAHDLMGRFMVPGWDREGATAAYRQVLRIEPNNTFAATQLSVFLEHDTAAKRYAPGAKLNEAIATLDHIDAAALAAYKDGGFVHDALFDLLYADRCDELAARLAKAGTKAPAVPAIVVATLRGSADAGLAELKRRRMSDADRRETLTLVADFLVSRRRYAEAAQLLDGGAEGASDDALRRRGRILAKAKEIVPAALPTTRPEDVVRKAFTLCALSPRTLKDDVRPLVATRDADRLHGLRFEGFCEGISSVAKTPSNEVFADIWASMMELRTEGSDRTGYMVTSLNADGSTTKVFVVRESGAYKILAAGEHPGALGCEALALHKAGRTDAAAQWLTWARAAYTPASINDPLRDTPFATLWSDKKDDIELGAAALCAQDQRPEIAVPTLTKLRADASAARAATIDHALALAYLKEGHDAELLETATRLARAFPTSNVPWSLRAMALLRLGRFQELRDAAATRLASAPNDPVRLDDLASAEAILGHFKEARALGERVIASGRATAGTYNSQAWRSLYLESVSAKDLEYAQKAVELDSKSAANLNTLAAVEIAIGRLADGHDHLLRAIDVRENKEPDAGDWYVFGRLAEQLGANDEAKAAYAKAQRDERGNGQATLKRLVDARMRGLK